MNEFTGCRAGDGSTLRKSKRAPDNAGQLCWGVAVLFGALQACGNDGGGQVQGRADAATGHSADAGDDATRDAGAAAAQPGESADGRTPTTEGVGDIADADAGSDNTDHSPGNDTDDGRDGGSQSSADGRAPDSSAPPSHDGGAADAADLSDTTWDAPDAGNATGAGPQDPAPYVETEPSTQAFRSGARLAVRLFVAEGGAEQFSSFVDKLTGEPCRFSLIPDTDGEYRCMNVPFALPTFADASCSEPVVNAGDLSAGDLVGFGIRREGSCGTDNRYFEVGETIELVDAYLVDPRTGECVPTTLRSQWPVFRASPADLTPWVRGQQRQELLDAATGLAVVYLDGDDGSSVFSGFQRFGQPCSARLGADGQQYCVPNSPMSNRYTHADDACAGPALVALPEDACSPEVSLVSDMPYDEQGCQLGERFYEVGPAVTELYSNGSGDCEPMPSSDSEQHFELGTPIPYSTLPHLTITERGSGRALLRQETSDTGRLGWPRAWYDTEFGVECSPEPVAEGVARCVPWQDYVNRYGEFTDDQCTQPCFHRSDYSCDALPPVLVTRELDGFVRLAPHPGAVFTLDADGACAESVRSSINSYFGIERAMNLDEFPLLIDEVRD